MNVDYVPVSDPENLRQAHDRIVAIRVRQASAAKVPVRRDWLLVATPDRAPIILTARGIIRDTAEKYGVSVGEIMGYRRGKPVRDARFAAYHAVALAFPSWSMTKIGHIFGRDHTTIIHGIRCFEAENCHQTAGAL